MLFMDVDTALASVPVNVMPLTDDTDFKSRETSVAYNAAGMDLVWNFVTTAGVSTQTAVTPTTSGDYDWTNLGDGMYALEIPASGGASINNDTEGIGYFSGICTGVLPWRGPDICFRAAALNNSLIDAGTTGLLAPTVAARTLDVSTGGEAGLDWANIGSPTTTQDLSGTSTKALEPTTAGRKLDVSAGGEAGLDWANVGAPTTTLNLSGTTIKTATDVETDTQDIQSRLPAALISGRIDASVGAMAANVMTAAATAADYVTELQAGLALEATAQAIKTKTDALPSDPADQSAVEAAITAAEMSIEAAIAALNNLSAAQVKAQVVAALATDTYAEPTGVPAATATLATKIGRLHQALRNGLTVTATDKTFQDDGGSDLWKKPLSDDGTTYIEGEGTAP